MAGCDSIEIKVRIRTNVGTDVRIRVWNRGWLRTKKRLETRARAWATARAVVKISSVAKARVWTKAEIEIKVRRVAPPPGIRAVAQGSRMGGLTPSYCGHRRPSPRRDLAS